MVKEAGSKTDAYNSINYEIARLWKIKVKRVKIIVGSLRKVSEGLKKNTKEIRILVRRTGTEGLSPWHDQNNL